MNILSGEKDRNEDEFYASLQAKLEENHQFPGEYIFKFIFPNDNEKLSELYRVFDGLQYTINTRESANNKYIATTLRVFVLDAPQVIHLYREVQKIEGVVAL